MKDKKVRRFIFNLIMIASTIYIIYRAIFTLPIHYGIPSLIIGIIFLLMEIVEFIEFFIHYINVLKIDNTINATMSKELKKCPDVDVIIATINEDQSLIEENIKACLNLEYPVKNKVHIYISDDGNRGEIEALTKKYGVNYITRDNNIDAKAGNYNNALKTLKSPYILTLDADMIPLPNFLMEIIPYFYSKKNVGFVQTPQSFKNYDIFQTRFGTKNKMPFDQNFFYHYLQNIKSHTNTTICCGTNVIFLREALDKIGGFATQTLTEDIATGMLIESAGYKGVYVDKILAVGYSTNDINSFVKQRKRWAAGGIQMWKNYSILGNPGLDKRQKAEYFSCISYWFFSLRVLLYLIAPALYSILGFYIIECPMWLFLTLWLPQFLLKRYALDFIFGNKRSTTWNKIHETILFPALLFVVIKESLGIKKKKFETTEKKAKIKVRNTSGYVLFIWHAIFFIINVLSFSFSLYNNYILPLIFSLINLCYLMLAITFDLNNKTTVEDNVDKYNSDAKYSVKALFSILKG